MRIFVSGKFCSGKGFLVRPLVEAGFVEINFADVLKQEVATQYGTTVDEINANKGHWRSVLQSTGHGRRANDPNYWIKVWEEQARLHENVACSDVRYWNEAEYALSTGVLVRVDCPIHVRIARYKALYGTTPTPEQLNHVTETELDYFPFEYVNIFHGNGNVYENHARIKALAGIE